MKPEAWISIAVVLAAAAQAYFQRQGVIDQRNLEEEAAGRRLRERVADDTRRHREELRERELSLRVANAEVMRVCAAVDRLKATNREDFPTMYSLVSSYDFAVGDPPGFVRHLAILSAESAFLGTMAITKAGDLGKEFDRFVHGLNELFSLSWDRDRVLSEHGDRLEGEFSKLVVRCEHIAALLTSAISVAEPTRMIHRVEFTRPAADRGS